jgi:hypothetical protein
VAHLVSFLGVLRTGVTSLVLLSIFVFLCRGFPHQLVSV